ncbi:hypothetical protein IQ06DRAFT_236378 [Phaeosphaeriaceae sp. SRC1lsM3a]|nr:hypothetical protein IQ06DRAFT_236378 [Stagonospora sp. SRC1lsM3a]
MAKITGTTHHCPGAKGWVGDISPGGCRSTRSAYMTYCSKHQMPCVNGCLRGHHLKNQSGCCSCIEREEAAERRAKAQAEKQRNANRDDNAFWNPPKQRKR